MEVVQSSVLRTPAAPGGSGCGRGMNTVCWARVLWGIAQAWSRACAGSVLIQFEPGRLSVQGLEGQRPVPDF